MRTLGQAASIRQKMLGIPAAAIAVAAVSATIVYSIFPQHSRTALLIDAGTALILVFGWALALVYFIRLFRSNLARDSLLVLLAGLLALIAVRGIIGNLIAGLGFAHRAGVPWLADINTLGRWYTLVPKLLGMIQVAVILWAIKDGLFHQLAVVNRRERETALENQYLAGLHMISQAIGTSLQRDELLNRALNKVLETMNMGGVWLYLLNESGDALDLIAHVARESKHYDEIKRVPRPSGILWLSIEKGEPITSECLEKDEELARRTIINPTGIGGFACIPIYSEGRCVGAFLIRESNPRKFTPAEVQFLSDIGQQLGIAIENANLFAMEQARRREVESLLTISNTFGATLGYRETVQTIVIETRRLLQVDYASLRLFDEKKERLDCVAVSGIQPEHETVILETPISVTAEPVLQQALESRKPVAVLDMPKDERINHMVIPIQSMLAVPLIYQNEPIGFLYGATLAKQREFNSRELEIATALGQHAAMTIQNVRLYNETRQRARELGQAKAFTEGLINGIMEVVLSIDADGNCIYINPVGAHLLGYEPGDLIGKKIQETIYIPQLVEAARQGIENRVLRDIELPARHKDGIEILLSWNVSLDQDSIGKRTGLVAVGRDIRERKRIERELAYRDRILAGVAKATNDLLVSADLNEGIKRAIQALGESTGVHRIRIYENFHDAVSGLNWARRRWAWCAECGSKGPDEVIPADLSYEHVSFPWIETLKNGQLIQGITCEQGYPERTYLESEGILSFLIVPVFVEDQCWGVIVFSDQEHERQWTDSETSIVQAAAASIGAAIERNQAEMALRESEERYRGLVESQEELIVRVDLDGLFTFVNDAYCRKFGKSRDELIGSSFMPLVHEDDLPATLEAMKGLEVPPYRIQVEQRAMTAAGWRWIAWEDYAVKDADGNTVEIQATGRDITEQKQLEQDLLRRNTELSVLNSIVETINQSLDLDEILSGTLEKLIKFLDVDAASIVLHDEQTGELSLRACRGVSSEGLTAANWMLTKDSQGRLAPGSDKPVVSHCENPGSLLKVLIEREGLCSFASVPLKTDRKILGNLNIATRTHRDFSVQDLGLLNRAANHLATAVINSRLYQAEQRKAQSLAVLMREAHHRIRNNLQTIASLLNLEMQKGSRGLDESSLRKSLHRIKSVALVHELLLHDDTEAVDMKTFAEKLASSIVHTGAMREKQIHINVTGDHVLLQSKLATSIALAINELVDNSIEHGFRNRSIGNIRIEFEEQNGQVTVRVSDDGAGPPPGFDLSKDSNVGFRVVKGIIVQDMGGTFTLTRGKETTATLQFPRGSVTHSGDVQ